MLLKMRVVIIAFAVSTITLLGMSSSRAYAAGDASFSRLSGQDRYGTAVEISKNGWNQSDSVILAYGEDFPDGLAGVTLAYAKNAPILLTTKNQLPQPTLSEIQRLGAKNIYILGGTGVISDNIEQELKISGYNVERISGLNRFQTAIEVGKSIRNSNSDTAVIATAYDFPDALSIGPAAARNNMPILFTDKENLTSDTKQALINWGIKKVIIVGGTGVVSNQVEANIKALGITIERLSGTDRYATSLSIAKRFNVSNTKNILLAKGEDFPDALAGGALAAKEDTPILLTGIDNISDDILGYFDELNAQDIYILGGTGAINDSIKDFIKLGTLGNTQGNILNKGYAVKQGDWIYYCQYDPSANYPFAPNNSAIYKMKYDGSNKIKVVTTSAYDLNIKGDWLYYLSYTDSKIHKVKTDGSNNQVVSDRQELNNMIISGNLIYVSDNMPTIEKLGLDGSFDGVSWGSPRDFVVSGNTIYFNYMGDGDSIWSSSLSNTKLNNEASYNINLYRNNLYYLDSQNDICSMSIGGENKTLIGSEKATSIIVDEGWIYYSNKNDNGKLYKMRIDGSSRVQLSDNSILGFNIVGDWVFYYNNSQASLIKK